MITKSGYRLEIGRVSKQAADALLGFAPPEPPTRKVTVWGGVEEEIPDPAQPEYQKQLQEFYAGLKVAQWELLHQAVKVLDNIPHQELRELWEVGLEDALRYIVLSDPEDTATVVNEILYQATVTQRGIEEAQAKFGVTWRDVSLDKWGIPKLPCTYSQAFLERKAAKYSLLSYAEFCQLSGPEQSEYVAFFLLDSKLEYKANEPKNPKKG